MPEGPLKVAWISYFPIEWLPDLPEPLQNLPRQHPAPWQRVLLEELRKTGVRSQESVPTSKGIELHVVVVRKQFPSDCTFERDGVTFHCLKAPGGWRRPSLFWVDTVLIRRCLKQIRPDLVHAWGTEDGAALVASRLGYPYLVTVQGLLQWYAQEIRMPLINRLASRLESISLSRARVASAESSFSVEFVRRHYPKLEVHHVDVVPDAFFHAVQRKPETKPPRLLFLGTLGFRKGGDLFLRALEKLSTDWKAVIVGDVEPEMDQQLRPQLSAGLWSRLEFKRQLGPEGVAQELSQATILVCPTRADTGPMAVKEAAVAGVPVVGSAVGGIPDYVIPGKNGLLFPSGDLEGCLKTLREAVAHPLFSQGNVEEETLVRMREYLSPQVMRDGFLAAYKSVMERDRGINR